MSKNQSTYRKKSSQELGHGGKKSPFAQVEEEILEFWKKNKIFEKSVARHSVKNSYVFYDGPPFATGLPHYGNILASIMKDIIPRYWTMRGRRVERVWGWDCHGLPIENIVESELKLKNKKDIEKMGVEKFNEACRSKVLMYADEWKKTIPRLGRWVDMENAYKTMDLGYMQSIWWVFKSLWDRGLIYEGRKAMHICPRCETTLSNFEVTQGYQDIEDYSVTVKFKLVSQKETYILAWTTTPWTLPGNMFLALNPKIEYVKVNFEGDNYILAKDRLGEVFKEKKYRQVEAIDNKTLEGEKYEPLFPYFSDREDLCKVVLADFVTIKEGTGVVHLATGFGEEDMLLGQELGVEPIMHVKMDGTFTDEVVDFARKDAKTSDKDIVEFLKENGKVFGSAPFAHSYPHCWRCDTPLLNYTTFSWFVKVTELKDRLIENNKKIRWVPDHIKEGRFGKWLQGAQDWAISRSRFWGTPLPVWRNVDDPRDMICVGSQKELEKLSRQKVDDLHKHVVDKIKIKKGKKTYQRVPEVLDCWFESGSMPYAQFNYPAKNKKKFLANFPAEFIAEGQDQTRGWFYTLHVLAAALTGGKKPAIAGMGSRPAFLNVIVNGIVLAEDGKKMSKRLKNYPEPDLLFDKYGADSVRYYLSISPAMKAESLNFSEKNVKEVYQKFLMTLWNVVSFYKIYGDKIKPKETVKCTNVLDQWIFAKLKQLNNEVTKNLDKYDIPQACRPTLDFVQDLSNWYLRRSRDRFKSKDNICDHEAALRTLRQVLLQLSQLIAPFTPFLAERIYQTALGTGESVHLTDWPASEEINNQEKEIMENMEQAMRIVEAGHALRKESGLRVRQPLAQIVVAAGLKELPREIKKLVADELNIKEVVFSKKLPKGVDFIVKEGLGFQLALDTTITDQLKEEGLRRELTHHINSLRKKARLTVNDQIKVYWQSEDKYLDQLFSHFADNLKKETLARSIEQGGLDKNFIASGDLKVEDGQVKVGIEKVKS